MAETFEDNQYLISRGATFEELRNDQKHSDVVIVTSDGTKFPCHKIILIAGCPFFKGLFASDMVESRQNEVNLNPIDISGSHFKLILEFIYTGKIKLNFEDAKSINIYAGLFTMTNLKSITEICLMKNITKETCLELWRHSEKYLSDKLKESCLLSANSEVFLDTHIENLTMAELKSIVSLKNINSKILLKNIVKWIKIDFEDRQQYIKDLMELINFDDIKDEEYRTEIFSDEILIENKEFLKLSTKFLLRLSSTSASRATENVVNIPKKTLFVATERNFFYTDFDNKEFVLTTLRPETIGFATSSHPRNGFVTTGGTKMHTKDNLCTQFCPSKSVQKEFPKLTEAHVQHRNYTVGSKIYTCGGVNSSTVEIFEEKAEKWIYGPHKKTCLSWFGAADDGENNLYAVDGTGVLPALRVIEHLDIRMNSWQVIYAKSSVIVGFTQSLYKGDQIYCFGRDNGFIFDIRANKKLATISYKLVNSMGFQFSETLFDCTIVDNEIWLIGKLYNPNRTERPNAFKLDLQTNTWERKLFKGLHESDNLQLVWCKNN